MGTAVSLSCCASAKDSCCCCCCSAELELQLLQPWHPATGLLFLPVIPYFNSQFPCSMPAQLVTAKTEISIVSACSGGFHITNGSNVKKQKVEPRLVECCREMQLAGLMNILLNFMAWYGLYGL
jgi:hypothetical protein